MSAFDDFQLKEYDKIADAHFKTNESIGTFFRYYLLIMTVPASAAGLLITARESDHSIKNLQDFFIPLLPGILFVTALIGFFMMLYLIGLRLDAILYARTENAIRKYFYDKSDIDIVNRQKHRILPQTSQRPPYFESTYFLPVVFAFAFLDSSYIYLAKVVVVNSLSNSFVSLNPITDTAGVCFFLAFFIAHIISYGFLSKYRENSYLTTAQIGVDIDGVLADHRQHFCRILKEKHPLSTLSPAQITRIPVRDIPGAGLTKMEHEIPVFQDARYWLEMPVMAGAEQNLRRLQNGLLVKIHIYTHRPWPDPLSFNGQVDKANVFKQWREAIRTAVQTLNVNSWVKWRLSALGHLDTGPMMRAMTEIWLRRMNIPFDSILVEAGSDSIAQPRYRLANRFQEARKKRLKFFVEDSWENALKLAFVCDVVFLLDQPYNTISSIAQSQPDGIRPIVTLPKNVIRVNGWTEIYQIVRQMM